MLVQRWNVKCGNSNSAVWLREVVTKVLTNPIIRTRTRHFVTSIPLHVTVLLLLLLLLLLWFYTPLLVLGSFSVSWSCTESLGLLGRSISPSQGRYLHTEQHKHRINAHTNIHALSGIRTHDPSVRAATVIGSVIILERHYKSLYGRNSRH
jgi:hypothetical protein